MITARRLSVDVPVIEVDSPSQPVRTLQVPETQPQIYSLDQLAPAAVASTAASPPVPAAAPAPTHVLSLSIQSLAAHQLEHSSFDLVVSDSGRAPKKWRHPSFGSMAAKQREELASSTAGGESDPRPTSALSSTNAVHSVISANDTERGGDRDEAIEWLAFGDDEAERRMPEYDAEEDARSNTPSDDAATHSYDSDLPRQHRATSFDPAPADLTALQARAKVQGLNEDVLSPTAPTGSGGPSPLEQPLSPLCAVLDEVVPPQFFKYPSIPSADSSAPASPARGSIQARRKRRDTGSMAMGGLSDTLLSQKRAEKVTDSPSITRVPSTVIPPSATPSFGPSTSASANSSSQGILVASALPAHLKPKRLHGATNRSSIVSVGSSTGSFSQGTFSDGNSPFFSTTPSPFMGSSSNASSPSHRVGSIGSFGLDAEFSSRSSMTSGSMNSLMGFGLGFATNANGNWESPRATGGSRSSIVTSPSSPGGAIKTLSPVTRVKSYAHHFQSHWTPASAATNTQTATAPTASPEQSP
jgi:hypothetical protein